MKLIDVYTLPSDNARQFLFDMLKDRDPVANISHREMPSWEDHCAFVSSRPYAAWYVIEDSNQWIGAIYLTKANEIGVFIIPGLKQQGWGTLAVKYLMAKHRGLRYLANVSPKNEASMALFEGLGFRHIQNTLELET